jgi:hypothetical protein
MRVDTPDEVIEWLRGALGPVPFEQLRRAFVQLPAPEP